MRKKNTLTAQQIVNNDLVNKIKNNKNIFAMDTSTYSTAMAIQHGVKPTTVERYFRQFKNSPSVKALYKASSN